MRRKSRTSIPKGATEIIEQSFESGAKQQSSYVLNSQKVGLLFWKEDGTLLHEHVICNGKKYGRYDNFHANGEPYEVTPYRHGKFKAKGFNGPMTGPH